MALFDVEIIGNVTRMELRTGYLYHFPLEVIETNTHGNYMSITPRGESRSQQVDFSELTEKYGQTTIKAYVDQLAIRGFYSSSELEAERLTLGDGTLANNFQVVAIDLLNDMSKTLEKILFVLKGISE